MAIVKQEANSTTEAVGEMSETHTNEATTATGYQYLGGWSLTFLALAFGKSSDFSGAWKAPHLHLTSSTPSSPTGIPCIRD
jgi:hypothetical protein